MRFGVMLLQAGPYATLADRWRRIEDMGFDSMWIADHTSSQYSMLPYEAWSLLGAMAAVTKRVRFGPLVTPPTFRHPSMVAMQAVTIDQISGGRLELGLGAGGGALDAGFVGQPEPNGRELMDRLAEYVEILDRLLRDRALTFDGRHYTTRAAVGAPVQQPRPPLVIAAQGPRGLDLVARYADTWNTLGGQPMRSVSANVVTLDQAVAATRSQIERLERACAAIGRDPKTLRRSVLAFRAQVFRSTDTFEEFVSRYQELGFDECIAYWPYEPGTMAAVPDQEAVLERVAADVLPRLRREAAKT
jgi:alkanesulfonate monooxygenase SsuD/methylene tetrahydromethanopterin reductase-like flavin-dependent oxidoreductase (luciferase family)